MPNKIENPHDKFFKESFSRKSSVVPFLKAYLPEEVKQLIDFETLETENSHFVDEDLKESISDLVYRVQIAGKTSYLYLLFEHKSYRDWKTPLQLLNYMVKLWESLLKKNPNLKTLPPIFPLVLYQGKDRWEISTDFQGLFDLQGEAKQALQPYLPQFQYGLLDLSQLSFEKLQGDVYGKLALYLMKSVVAGNLKANLKKAAPLLAELLQSKDSASMMRVLFKYAFATSKGASFEEIKEVFNESIPSQIGEEIMTIAEELEARGRAEGEARGRAEGEARGRAEGEARGRTEGRTEGEVQLLKTLLAEKMITETCYQEKIKPLQEKLKALSQKSSSS